MLIAAEQRESGLSLGVGGQPTRRGLRTAGAASHRRDLAAEVGLRREGSLGSFGAEEAFSGEYDLNNRTSGALFVGPPNFNPMYRSFIDDRDPGSREIEPIYRDGRIIRFTTRAERPPPQGRPWPESRVLYLQHASDPVTWWSTDLILSRPDWLEEPRGNDVPAGMRWMPLVIQGGYVRTPDKPGLGVELNREALKRLGC